MISDEEFTEKNKIDRVLAYFTLSNDKIAVMDFPSNSQKYLRSYPSVKIGRFAISKKCA